MHSGVLPLKGSGLLTIVLIHFYRFLYDKTGREKEKLTGKWERNELKNQKPMKN